MNPTGNDELVRFVIGDAAGSRIPWAEGMQFTLTRDIYEKIILSNPVDADAKINLKNPVQNIPASDARLMRLRKVFTLAKPATSRFPISYQNVPPWLRSLVASTWAYFQRRKVNLWAVFPQWPLDLSADFVADLAEADKAVCDGGRAPVILTHDIDSPEGMRNYVDLFMEHEIRHGARSTCFVVPSAWDIDFRLVDTIVENGNEIGIHGYDHSNRTAFAETGEMRRRLDAARPLIERYGITGYRAPSLLRTRELMRELSKIYRYDSSIPTSGGLFPTPNNGCATARPFVIEGVAELPLSLPRDGMLRFLGHSPRGILELWIRCAETIADSGGVIVLLTHCERRFSGNAAMLDAYRDFLEYVGSSEKYEWSTPEKVLRKTDMDSVDDEAGGACEL